jgi:hypothetical protein
MQMDQRVQDVADALDTQRHKLADMDFAAMPDVVLTAAHDALPKSWRWRKEPSRWPYVAGALILATLVAGFLFLLPALRMSRRPIEDAPDARTFGREQVPGEPLAEMATAFELEERSNGAKVAF